MAYKKLRKAVHCKGLNERSRSKLRGVGTTRGTPYGDGWGTQVDEDNRPAVRSTTGGQEGISGPAGTGPSYDSRGRQNIPSRMQRAPERGLSFNDNYAPRPAIKRGRGDDWEGSQQQKRYREDPDPTAMVTAAAIAAAAAAAAAMMQSMRGRGSFREPDEQEPPYEEGVYFENQRRARPPQRQQQPGDLASRMTPRDSDIALENAELKKKLRKANEKSRRQKQVIKPQQRDYESMRDSFLGQIQRLRAQPQANGAEAMDGVEEQSAAQTV